MAGILSSLTTDSADDSSSLYNNTKDSVVIDSYMDKENNFEVVYKDEILIDDDEEFFRIIRRDVEELAELLRRQLASKELLIRAFEEAADYIDSVYYNTNVSHAAGTAACVLGGGLTIAGGVLTVFTMGAASPLLVSGIAISLAGTGTKIGTLIAKKIIESRQIKQLELKLDEDRKLAGNVKDKLDKLRKCEKDDRIKAAFVAAIDAVTFNSHFKKLVELTVLGAQFNSIPAFASRFLSSVGVKGLAETTAKTAGTFTVGLSAVLIIVDAIDLGMTINDLINEKGSEAAAKMRQTSEMIKESLLDFHQSDENEEEEKEGEEGDVFRENNDENNPKKQVKSPH